MNAVPGAFPSEQTANYSENYKKAVIKTKIPTGRLDEPEDVAATCVFLAGEASAYITGVTLPVDGGVLINRLGGSHKGSGRAIGAGAGPGD